MLKLSTESGDCTPFPIPKSVAECLLSIVFLPVILIEMIGVVVLICGLAPFVCLVFGVKDKIVSNEPTQQNLEKVENSGIYKFLFDKF